MIYSKTKFHTLTIEINNSETINEAWIIHSVGAK